MAGDQDRSARVGKFTKFFKHQPRVGRVQIASRFVGNDQCRPMGQRSSQRHPLSLAVTERVGSMTKAIIEPEFREPLFCRRGRDSSDNANVIENTQVGNELQRLEQVTDLAGSKLTPAGDRQLENILLVDQYISVCGFLHGTTGQKQGGFTAAAIAFDGRHGCSIDRKVNPAQHFDSRTAASIEMIEVFDLEHVCHGNVLTFLSDDVGRVSHGGNERGQAAG